MFGSVRFTLVWMALALGGVSVVAAEGKAARPTARLAIPAGVFRPLYAPSPAEEIQRVDAFLLDRVPVTNGQLLAFVKAHPAWRRDRVPPLFAEPGYLSHWAGPDVLGEGVGVDQPATWVSWFLASAYCEAHGGRLPSELEWEYVASASETQVDGRNEEGWQQRILAWYARPATATLPPVGQGAPNVYGVMDLHGLVWEWVAEVSSTLVSGDSREGAGADPSRFCGAGALTAGDKGDYASFMRYAFRGSLQARYSTASLGFRCAADVGGGGR